MQKKEGVAKAGVKEIQGEIEYLERTGVCYVEVLLFP